MKTRLGEWLTRPFGWAVALAVFVWPTTAFGLRIWRERALPSEASFDAGRHAALLARSVGLALAGAIVAVLIALPLTFALTRGRRIHRSTPLLIAAMATLLCPPMVPVFGWQRILGVHRDPYLLTIAVWALWAWPIAGALLTASWSRRGQAAYEALLLDASAGRAFAHSVTGVLRAPSVLCVFLLTAVFLNEYSVPHACGLTVYATELLGIATSSSIAKDTLLGSIPLVGALLLLGAACLRGAGTVRLRDLLRSPSPPVGADSRKVWRLRLVCFGILLGWLGPMSALTFRADFVQSVGASFLAYGWDLAATVGVASAASALAIPIAWAIAGTIRGGFRGAWIGLAWVAIVGFLPGALVGEAFIAAYNRPALAAIADHWPVIALAQCARFAWIPALAMVASLLPHNDVREQAALDGADGRRRFWAIDWPMSSTSLLAGVGCMTALACGDAVVAGLLRVPDYRPIALLIIEKFHRFEDGLLAALSVSLAALGFVAATAIAMFSRSRRT